MRNVAFLGAGIGLLMLQSNVFRVLDGIRPALAIAVWAGAVLSTLSAPQRTRGPRQATRACPPPSEPIFRCRRRCSSDMRSWRRRRAPTSDARSLRWSCRSSSSWACTSTRSPAARRWPSSSATPRTSSGSRRSGSTRSLTSRRSSSPRAAGVRLAAQTTWMQVVLVGAFTLLQSTMILVLLAIFGRDAVGAAHPLPAGSTARARDRGHRAAHLSGSPVDPLRDGWGSAERGGRELDLMTNLLVPRSDVGEFRKRYKWMALFAFLAFVAVVARLVPATSRRWHTSTRPSRTRTSSGGSSLPTTRGVIRDANGKVLASSRAVVRRARGPGTRDAERSARSLPERPRHSARPRLMAEARRDPAAQPRGAARLRRAHPDGVRQRRGQVPLLEDAHPGPRGRAAGHRRRAEAAHERAGGGRRGGRAGALLSVPATSGAHMLGYVAEIDAEALVDIPTQGLRRFATRGRQRINPLGYEAGDTVGATGLEHAWESYLRGQRGWEKRVVDARGRYRSGPEAERLIDAPGRLDPIPGRDLRLSIDVDLEQAIDRSMRAHAAGAVVVVDVRTGRLLALYSKPDFDPNDLSGGAGRGACSRGVRPPLRRPAATDARQDDERRVPAGVDDEAFQRPRRPGGPSHRARTNGALRRLCHLRPPRLPLQPRARSGASARSHRRARATSISFTWPRR